MISIFTKLKPKWIALSSLFYEGDITATVIIDEHKGNRKSHYNVYSIPKLDRLSREFGYAITKVKKFFIDVDLPMPSDLDFCQLIRKLLSPKRRIPGSKFRVQC